ncbi:5707_t:CDS:2 [Entrophospora sp. SA101]|nr:19778_t:CDS:2 [Entrophospora sp. SA101]CAJ0760061.1 5707_t:CDS:2 [Entrophospora sp. SA101]
MSDTASNDTETVTYAVTEEQGKTNLLFSLVESVVSLVAVAFGIFVYFYIRYKYPRLVDRVTFRLALATMISDFGICIALLINSAFGSPIGSTCTGVIWAYVFFSLTSIFFPTCIALNLQIVFLHEYRGRCKLEMLYFTVSTVLALILSLLPFADHMYAWNYPEGGCFFRDSGTKLSITWQWGSFYVWEILCILYCIIILICVAVKLYKNRSVNANISGQTVTSQYEKNVLRNKTIMSLVVKKAIWYPIVPIITQAPNFLVETDIYVNQRINYAFLIMSSLNAAQGFLNTIVFMQDIAVSRAYRLTKLNWWYNHVNKYEESYPHLSRNKAFGPLDSADRVDNEAKNEQKQQIQKQPSFGEKLRYNLLTLLFSKPKGDEMLTEYDQYMTVKNDEELVSTQSINDDDAKVKDGEGAIGQFNKNNLYRNLYAM